MMTPQQAQEVLMVLELQLQRCVSEDRAKPDDVENLIAWGQVSMELAMFKAGDEATELINQAVAKLKQASSMRPADPKILLPLAQAQNMCGFNSTDKEHAEMWFEKSIETMKKAVEMEPTNEEYKKNLENLQKAPGIHEQLLKTMADAAPSAPPSSAPSGGRGAAGAWGTQRRKPHKNNELLYQLLGWGVLVGGLFYIARRITSPAPPPPR